MTQEFEVFKDLKVRIILKNKSQTETFETAIFVKFFEMFASRNGNPLKGLGWFSSDMMNRKLTENFS